jgi:alpha-tubulin suppressor-like RCC1 family protein
MLAPVPVQVALGLDYGCARFSDGGLQCWGSNLNGQVGRPVNNTMKPGNVPLPQDVDQGVIGQATVARLSDGTVWGWGTMMLASSVCTISAATIQLEFPS